MEQHEQRADVLQRRAVEFDLGGICDVTGRVIGHDAADADAPAGNGDPDVVPAAVTKVREETVEPHSHIIAARGVPGELVLNSPRLQADGTITPTEFESYGSHDPFDRTTQGPTALLGGAHGSHG